MDDNGMVPKALERAIKENSGGIPQVITAAKPYWAMVYMMPTFQNPTGFCLSSGEYSHHRGGFRGGEDSTGGRGSW